MPTRFYLDTSIWRDYFEDRSDGTRPLGEFAFRFLVQCRENGCVVIVSDAVRFELMRYFSKERVKEIFFPFEDVIVNVYATEKQVSDATAEWLKMEKRLPFDDVLHAFIARHHGAVLVARDRHFFEFLSGLVKMDTPENLTLA